MPETVDQLKEAMGNAVRALTESTAKLEAARTELSAMKDSDAAAKTAQEARLKKLEEDHKTLSSEHDDLTVRLQDPKGNMPGANPGDAKSQLAARSAYGKFLRNLQQKDLLAGMNEDEKVHVLTVKAQAGQTRSIYVSNDELGGFIVNPVMTQRIVEKLIQVSPIRQHATVMSIGTGRELVMHRETGELATRWTQETGTRTDSTPSDTLWQRVEIQTYEQSGLVPISYQMIEDTWLNIEAWVESRISKQFARAEGIAFLTGDGNGKPRGILTHPQVESVAATPAVGAGKFTPDDVQNLLGELETEYAMNGLVISARKTVMEMRKFKDDVKRPLDLVQRDALAKIRSLLLDGYPLAEMPAMPLWGTASAKNLAFGDFQEGYCVVDRSLMTVIRDPFTRKTSGLVELQYMRRVGGDVVQPDAIKVLTSSAS